MSDFHSYSITHFAMLAGFVAFTIALVWIGRCWDKTPRGRALDLTLAILAIAFWLLDHGRGFLPGAFNPSESIPIHVCNLAGICVPIVLLTRNRTFRAVLYFWGIGLSSQSIFTPDLAIGPATLGFWMYWVNHTIVISVPIYDVLARGYRPTWNDYGRASLTSAIYIAMMVPLDIALHANYGFLGQGSTKQRSILDALGPWPQRIIWVALLGYVAMSLLMIPWLFAPRVRVNRALPELADPQHN